MSLQSGGGSRLSWSFPQRLKPSVEKARGLVLGRWQYWRTRGPGRGTLRSRSAACSQGPSSGMGCVMAWPPSCCAVLETRAQDTGWRGVLEPLGWPRCRSFPDAALGGMAHPDCLMGGHVGGLGCPLTALHSWGHLEALGKGGRVAGLPACVLLAGQTPPTTGTCSHTQIHSPLSFSTPVPWNTRHHWSAAPYPGVHSHPTLSPHMSFQTHAQTMKTPLALFLSEEGWGGQHLAFCLCVHFPSLPCTHMSCWHQLPKFSGDLLLSALSAQGSAEAEPTSEPGQAEQRPASLWHRTQLGQREPWTGTFQKVAVPWLHW